VVMAGLGFFAGVTCFSIGRQEGERVLLEKMKTFEFK
jgi:hypothetical protein